MGRTSGLFAAAGRVARNTSVRLRAAAQVLLWVTVAALMLIAFIIQTREARLFEEGLRDDLN